MSSGSWQNCEGRSEDIIRLNDSSHAEKVALLRNGGRMFAQASFWETLHLAQVQSDLLATHSICAWEGPCYRDARWISKAFAATSRAFSRHPS